MELTLGWLQFILPVELAFSFPKSVILRDTLGPFGEIAEIFEFGPQPEGFIIFHDHPEIPSINVVMSPQHNLIQIKNPRYTSSPLWSAGAPHYPNRRQTLGTLLTLLGRGSVEPTVATVVATEQNIWH